MASLPAGVATCVSELKEWVGQLAKSSALDASL